LKKRPKKWQRPKQAAYCSWPPCAWTDFSS
jgi:hypothetical protein